MSSGSGNLPAPSSPQAKCPTAGSTILTPQERRVCKFLCTACELNITEFIAGTTHFSPCIAKKQRDTGSSPVPEAKRAKLVAEQGATM
ncbi:hypothetical protein R83H12_02723 [Fibrobacteria bacterium R8-3-H12]